VADSDTAKPAPAGKVALRYGPPAQSVEARRLSTLSAKDPIFVAACFLPNGALNTSYGNMETVLIDPLP